MCTHTHTQTNVFDCIVANVRALIRNQFQQKQFLHFLNVSSFYYCSVCGGITALSGRFTLIRGVLSVFHRGTIIPESKLRRVHGRVDESCSFFLQCCLLAAAWRPLRKAMLCPPDTSIRINTKDSKLWKSQRKRATETCDTWFYLLWFRVDTQSYLEPYRVYFKSLFIMFCFFCFFFFSWAGRCSSQYYHVVDDCTATFCFCYIWMSFFFFAFIFKYMWILVFLFLTLVFVSFRIFGNGISTEIISSTKRHCHHVFLLLYKIKDRAAVQLRVVTGMFQLGKTGDLHFPLYIPYMSVCHRLTFAVFAKTRAERRWCTQQWGAFFAQW